MKDFALFAGLAGLHLAAFLFFVLLGQPAQGVCFGFGAGVFTLAASVFWHKVRR